MLQRRSTPRRLLAAGIACSAVLAGCDSDTDLAGPDGNGECAPAAAQTPAEVAAAMADGQARVRVNLVSRVGVEGNARDYVTLEGVSLFRGDSCQAIASPSRAALAGVENDVGAMVAEAAVGMGEVTHLELHAADEPGARRIRPARLALPAPLALEPGGRTELFVALEPVAGSDELEARFVAGGPVALDAGTVLVYEPARGAAFSGAGGLALDLPAGSLADPVVLGVTEHRTGDVAPLVSVTPAGALARAGRVTLPLDRGRIPGGMTMDDYGGFVGSEMGVTRVDGGTATVDVASLGDVRLRTDVSYVDLPDGTRMRTPGGGAAAAGTEMLVNNTCSQRLASRRTEFFDMLANNLGLLIHDCENVAPYVHIVMVNLNHGSPGSFPRIVFPGTRYASYEYSLKTLSEHAASVGAWTAVNGFTWSGDEGTGTGQYGVPIGNVRIAGSQASPWYTGAEAIIGFTSSSSTGGTYAGFFDKPAGYTINWGSYGYNAVPSTTSIVKNRACSRSPGGEDNRWSALGFGSGALVMASSVSGYTTTAYELCSVFEGLGTLGGAIRLDGGPSAAIYWSGSGVLNPLTGTYTWKYGSLRRIPYAVAGDY